MSVINKITKHFNDKVHNNLQKYHVDEWDTDVYFYPTYSFKDEQKILTASATGNTVDALVETLLIKARDGSGKRLFNDADRASLIHEADPQVIIKVASAINNATEMSAEEVEKN